MCDELGPTVGITSTAMSNQPRPCQRERPVVRTSDAEQVERGDDRVLVLLLVRAHGRELLRGDCAICQCVCVRVWRALCRRRARRLIDLPAGR